MPYVVDPTNSAAPLDTDYAVVTAAELRALKGYIQTQLTTLNTAIATAASKSPIGSIIAFAGTVAPAHFLALGVTSTLISRTTYASLFAVIGTTWGVGDGSTTFGLPPAAAGHALVSGNDATVGTITHGAVISHKHIVTGYKNGDYQPPNDVYSLTTNGLEDGTNSNDTSLTGGTDNLAAGPKVLFCIRYE